MVDHHNHNTEIHTFTEHLTDGTWDQMQFPPGMTPAQKISMIQGNFRPQQDFTMAVNSILEDHDQRLLVIDVCAFRLANAWGRLMSATSQSMSRR